MTKKAKLTDLESSLTEINTLIEKMEKGELTLEQSLNSFEQGIVLIKNCQKILRDAEQKVQVLIENSNNLEEASEELKPYTHEDDQA